VIPGETLSVGVGTGGIKAAQNEAAAGSGSNAGAGGGGSYIQRVSNSAYLVRAAGAGGGGGTDGTNAGSGGQGGGGGVGNANGGAGGAGTGTATTGFGGSPGTSGSNGPGGPAGTGGAAGAAGAAGAGGNGAAGALAVCNTAGSLAGGAGGTGGGGKGGIFDAAAVCSDGGGGGGGTAGGGGGGSVTNTNTGAGGGGGGAGTCTGTCTNQNTGGNGTSGTGGTVTNSDATYAYCGASAGVGGAGAVSAASATAGKDGCVVISYTSASNHPNTIDVQTSGGTDLFRVASDGSTLFRDATDNTQAFRIQNSASTTFFTADTTNNKLIVGSSTTDTTQVLLQLDSFSTFADTASCATTTNQGALYYNSNSTAVRGCINGAWEDVVTTSGLGLLTFGIVPDSGPATALGDIPSAFDSGTGAWGPCTPSVGGSANIVAWTGCTVYSNGRKQIIAAGTATVSASTSVWQNLCIFSAGSAPTLGTASATEKNAQFPTWSATAPVLCLAEIKTGTSASTIAAIYDTRVFTTDVKNFADIITAATAVGNRSMVKATTLHGQYATTAATTDAVAGVIGTWDPNASSVPNAVIVTGGPKWVPVGAAGTIGQFIEASATAGQATLSGTIDASAYSNVGIALTNWSASATSCSTSTMCSGSVYTDLMFR
jgi:hypothetical protein